MRFTALSSRTVIAPHQRPHTFKTVRPFSFALGKLAFDRPVCSDQGHTCAGHRHTRAARRRLGADVWTGQATAVARWVRFVVRLVVRVGLAAVSVLARQPLAVSLRVTVNR